MVVHNSAGSAKTFIGCYWLVKSSLKYPESRWGLGRSELKTLKRTSLKTLYEVCKMQGLVSGKHYIYKEQASEVVFFNGSVIMLIDLAYLPSDPDFDRLGGYELTGAFVDEIAQIRKKAWDVLKTRLRYKLEEYGLIGKLFGSLNPSKNWVFTYFYKPNEEGKLESNKFFMKALPTDNPHLAKSYLEVLNKLPKAERDRLYLGLWESTDENQLISNENINNIFTNSFIKPTSNKYLTIDVARKGKDKTVILLYEGLVVTKMYEYKKNTIDEIVTKVKQLTKEYKIPMSNVIADESGVGGGLVDMLKCKGFVGGSKALNNENYLNLRTQAFYYLAKYISNNQIYISEELKLDYETKAQIIEELEQIQSDNQTLNDDKLRIISKDLIKSNIGRSPDYSDALSMRMYFEININKGIYSF